MGCHIHTHTQTVKKSLISYLGRRLVIHISTFHVVTLAVLAARHLSFAAPALLVDAATFTGTLEEKEASVITATPEMEHTTEAACGTFWRIHLSSCCCCCC